jgi:hypothetical protein
MHSASRISLAKSGPANDQKESSGKPTSRPDQWTGPSAPAQLDAIEGIDAKLLSEIFLEDPATATPPTGATTP